MRCLWGLWVTEQIKRVWLQAVIDALEGSVMIWSSKEDILNSYSCVESRSLPRGLNSCYHSFWSIFSLILIYWTHVSTCVFENHRFSPATTETMTKEWLSDSIWWHSNFQPTPWWQLDHTKALTHWGKCIWWESALFSVEKHLLKRGAFVSHSLVSHRGVIRLPAS